jgi:transcriptional regulator with XRE-family HTH domain
MSNTIRMIGRRVRVVREQLSYSIDEFAAEIGVTPGLLRDVEDGTVEIGCSSLAKVAKLSDKPIEFFVGGVRRAG